MTAETATLEGEIQHGADADHQVLEFTVGGDVYALDVADLVQIDDEVAVTRLPRSPAAVEGITDVRGDVTAVVDPGSVLGVDAATSGGYLLVTDAEDGRQKVGLLVDDVDRVRTYDEDDVDRREDLGELDSEGLERAVVEGVIRRERGDDVTLVGLLSLAAIVDAVGEGVA